MKGCLFQPGIAMFLGSSSAILSPSTIFSRTAEPSTFCRPFSVDMCGIDVNLVNGLLVMKNKPVDLSQSQKEKYFK